jgi:tRNA threonylcarbamoyladenosine biosynthesis protein TsaB
MTADLLLVIDTATRTPVVAITDGGGNVISQASWVSRHRHGEELLQRIDAVLAEAASKRSDIGGVIVGTGPGSFTGLRIGLATAKVIAYALGVPLVGVSTTRAVALASGATEIAVTLPAGAVDRYVHRLRIEADEVTEVEPPQLIAGKLDFDAAVRGATVVAIDIEAADGPAEPGATAMAGLAQALSRIGARELAQGRSVDPQTLVPAYVALPRGIAKAAAEMEWSPDLR